MTEGEAITPVQAQEAPAAEPAVEQTKAAEPAPASETAPVPKPVEASAQTQSFSKPNKLQRRKIRKAFPCQSRTLHQNTTKTSNTQTAISTTSTQT